MMPPLTIKPAADPAVLPLRMLLRREMKGQIVHDSIHQRPGWTKVYVVECDGDSVGFASIAVGGPWTGKPTFFEFYILPQFRSRAFACFELFLTESKAEYFEVQSNDSTTLALAMAFARDVESEKIVFEAGETTHLSADGATLRGLTHESEIRIAMVHRQGGGEWQLDVNGQVAGKGGILFHYNQPYGDIYMEVDEAFRRRGYGAWLVQELKRIAYQLGAIPAARCSPKNVASRKTLARAGMAPFAHILVGRLEY